MSGVSPVGVAAKGTVTGVRFCCGFLGLVIVASTFLPPFAPPRYVARLRRYYEGSDFCPVASSAMPMSRVRSHPGCDMISGGPGPLFAASPTASLTTVTSASFAGQFSLLISLDLPTIPPSTTLRPFRHARFHTLRHRRGRPRLSPGEIHGIGGSPVAWSRVHPLREGSPTGLAESSSLALRTGRSSQVALHLSSRKRSYRLTSGW
jgi:hypothetical protein